MSGSGSWDMPTSSDVAEMMSTLLGTPATVRDGIPVRPSKGGRFAVGTLVQQDDELSVLWVCDLDFAARAAGCLIALPKDRVEAEIQTGDLSESTIENGYEIANIGSRLFNDSGSPHLRISGYRCLTVSELDAQERRFLRLPKKRADFEVDIEGYGTGRVSFLAA